MEHNDDEESACIKKIKVGPGMCTAIWYVYDSCAIVGFRTNTKLTRGNI